MQNRQTLRCAEQARDEFVQRADDGDVQVLIEPSIHDPEHLFHHVQEDLGQTVQEIE